MSYDSRDQLGRITSKTETVAGTTSVYGYSYDSRGRLTEVTKDGAAYRSYTYDANGNRVTASEDVGAAVSATYDAQDRLTSYGDATYTYTPDGQLRTKTVESQTTTYAYDELGNLMEVVLPTKTVSYVVDGQRHRVTRKVDGTITNRYLYGQGLQPIAELNADATIKSQFVYASKAQVPDFMTKAGVTYRFVTDNVGSVRMVVNTTDGTIAQRIDYDPFGKVISDTNPGFQPFGFAGGLYDTDTGLTRFGFRDYNAEIGRWTTKDPILFQGGDTNLYSYVSQDPVNFVDPTGLLSLNPLSLIGRAADLVSSAGNMVADLAGTGLNAAADVLTKGVCYLGQGLYNTGKFIGRVGYEIGECAMYAIQCGKSIEVLLSPLVAAGATIAVAYGGVLACATIIGCIVAGPTILLGVGSGATATWKLSERIWEKRDKLFNYEPSP